MWRVVRDGEISCRSWGTTGMSPSGTQGTKGKPGPCRKWAIPIQAKSIVRNRRDQATYWLGTVRERATPRLWFVSDDSLMIKYCFSSNTASLLTEFSQHFLKWWFSNYQMCLLCLLVKMQIPVELSQPCSVVPGGPIPSGHSQFPSCSFLSPFPFILLSWYQNHSQGRWCSSFFWTA